MHAFIIENRFSPWSVGFIRANISSAFSANLPALFPNLIAADDRFVTQSKRVLLYGAVVEDEALSHKSTQVALENASPGDEIVFFEMGFLASSHSWSQAIQQRDPEMACLGYVYDDIAHYYMADYPNRLIQRLNGDIELSEVEQARAAALMERIVCARISKYNSQPLTGALSTTGASRRVLVVDQNFSDASTIYGRASEQDFKDMLATAVEENPDAEIWVKTHPDVTWVNDGKRTGFYNHLSDHGRVRILRDPINPYALFEHVDTVYVGTSGMGLEALFAGKRVVCFGAPFYAGWGLTDDRREIPHRHRSRSLEDIFHAFYIWYTIYHVPGAPVPSRIEDALDYIEKYRPVALPAAAEGHVPTISVIVPVYNVEKYIRECITSIQAQTFKDFEIIAVVDKSEDRSQVILEELAEHDPRIRILELPENVGPGFARNRGLDAARGTYIHFIDPDDYMPSRHHFDAVNEAIANDLPDMIRGRKAYEQLENEDGTITGRRQDKVETYFNEPFAMQSLTSRPEILHSRHFWNWTYRREFLQENDIRFITTYREERAFLLKALLSTDRISSLDSASVVYRIRPDSAVRRAQSRSDVTDQFNNFRTVVSLLHDKGAFDRSSDLFATATFQVAQFLHYLFWGFAYKTVLATEDSDFEDEFFEGLKQVLEGTGLRASDLSDMPTQLSAAHKDAHAYGLLFESILSKRPDLIDAARHLKPIAQSQLYLEFLKDAPTPRERALADALSLYARNDRVRRSDAKEWNGPKPRVVIHIGVTKTGSTYLQHLMEQNRPELLRKGVWYPEVGLFWQSGRSHKQAGHAQFATSAINEDPDLLNYISSGVSLMQGRVKTIVLSSEAFFLNPNAHLLAQYFVGYDVEMVVYLRRQDDWANSQYAEFVAGGAVNRVSASVTDWLAAPKTRDLLDYRQILGRWEHAVGRDHVHVRVYEPTQLLEGDLLKDFVEAAGLPDLSELPRPDSRQRNYGALSSAHIEVLRFFNSLPFPSRDAYFSFIQDVADQLQDWRKRNGHEMPKPDLLDIHTRTRILDTAQNCNAEIARRYLGRTDGILFLSSPPTATSAPIPLYSAELEIIAEGYRRHGSGMLDEGTGRTNQLGSSPAIVNYGLFGWRLWALTPFVRRRLVSRASPDLIREFDRDPATFLHNMRLERQRKAARYIYPQGNIYGPANIFAFWVPPIERALGKTRGDRALSRLRKSPILYFRTHPRRTMRIIGRLMFPIGEARKSGEQG
ncbi:glycosyltransferase [Qingshengfaniella alkalisoli]|nr:glycosyltransferase [Qingshengfaniella alkalisoli]